MDWIRFLEDNSVEYVSRGPNTKKGEVSIQCPWCGNDDPGQHMGISLTKDAFGCWRSVEHSGKSPKKLVQAILHCSYNQAGLIVGQYEGSDPETLDQALASLTGADKPVQKVFTSLTMPDAFKRIKGWGTTERYWNYLYKRGFDNVDSLVQHHNLKCANVGKWKDRIIVPIYEDKKLVNWTARALQNPHSAPRYMTLSEDEGALKNIKSTIFNYDELLLGGDLLFICEGPFDALKIDYYGFKNDTRATCIFGTQISFEQIYILMEISKLFEKKILLLDPEAIEASFNIEEFLQSSGVKIGRLKDGVEDPGAMNHLQVNNLIRRYKK